jgi:2-C-methyl-D-erythritol 2,4-cyclodiphosphate synthase
MRIGHGRDIHRVGEGGRLVLGGAIVATDRSFIAHSDGDVVYHAVVDAVLGALGQGDIGRIFANDDPRWQGADSRIFVQEAVRRATQAGYGVVNVDVTIVAESPRLAPHVDAMRDNLQSLLGGVANVKAGTNEGVDALGRGEAIQADVVVLLSPKP